MSMSEKSGGSREETVARLTGEISEYKTVSWIKSKLRECWDASARESADRIADLESQLKLETAARKLAERNSAVTFEDNKRLAAAVAGSADRRERWKDLAHDYREMVQHLNKAFKVGPSSTYVHAKMVTLAESLESRYQEFSCAEAGVEGAPSKDESFLGTCEFEPRPHEERGHFGAPCRNFKLGASLPQAPAEEKKP